MITEDYTDDIIQESTDATIKTIDKITRIVEGKVKNNCPVKSGKLKSTISRGVNQSKESGYVKAGSNDVEYTPVVEFRDNPFFRPAVDESMSAIKTIVKEEQVKLGKARGSMAVR